MGNNEKTYANGLYNISIDKNAKPVYSSIRNFLTDKNWDDLRELLIPYSDFEAVEKEIKDQYCFSDPYAVIMPEVTVHGGLTPKDVFNKTNGVTNNSILLSLNIISNNPLIYGKRRSKIASSLNSHDIIEQLEEDFDESLVGRNIAGLIREEDYKDKLYNNRIYYNPLLLNNVNLFKNTRMHEFNHALYHQPFLRSVLNSKQLYKIIFNAYSPNNPNSVFNDEATLVEYIASNSDIRNYLANSNIDYNNYDFLEWDGDNPVVKIPNLSGYTDWIRASISHYALDRYKTLINGNKNSREDEIKKEITDDINSRIRKALSTIAYNLNQNSNSLLYAKSGGKLISKGQAGWGGWFFRQLRRLVPTVALTTKETEKVAKKTETAANLQKGVLRALKISKSALFKELVNGLELEDRVRTELISRYNALDSNKQKAERDIIYNLMKNGLIHTITDFDLAVDKIGRGKQAKDPNLYKYKTLADFDSEHTLGYFLKLEEEKVAKGKYDLAFGSFKKLLNFPELGLSLYGIPETALGQTDLAYVMRMLDPKAPAPWCVLLADKEGNPTAQALKLWNQTYDGPKYVLVDKKGKIKYFKSGNEDFFDKQDLPMDDLEKIDQKTGIKTSYNIIGKLFPFRFTMNRRQRTMSNGNKIELYYTPNGTLIQGYIRRPNNHTALFYPKNEPAKVTSYEKGPENVPLYGTWVTTSSGQRLFKTCAEGLKETYDKTGRLLMQTQGGYGSIFGPKHVLTFGNGEISLWDRNPVIEDIAEGHYPIFEQHNIIARNEDPLFRQFSIPSTGELIKDGDYPDFRDIGDAILLLGFKFPIYKRGGVLKGESGTGWWLLDKAMEIISKNVSKVRKPVEKGSKSLKQGIKLSGLTSGNVNGISGTVLLTTVKPIPRTESFNLVVNDIVTHPITVAKSIPLYLYRDMDEFVDPSNFVYTNFDFLQKFYENLHNLKYGFSVKDKIESQLNKDNIKDNILLFNINARNAIALRHGFNLDLLKVSDYVNRMPITFHFFPFEDNGEKIRRSNYGWFAPSDQSVHINIGHTEADNKTALVIMHELGAHGLQDVVKKEIAKLNLLKAIYGNKIMLDPLSNLGNFKYTRYFPEEQNLLDDAFPVLPGNASSQQIANIYNRRQNQYTRADYASPMELGATNNEIKYIYAQKYGVDFSKLKKPEDLPDLIKLNGSGKMIKEPFTGIGSCYSNVYKRNLNSIIKDRYLNWLQTHPNPQNAESHTFFNGIERDLNDKLKKAVFYVGGLSGAAYLGSNLDNQEQ